MTSFRNPRSYNVTGKWPFPTDMLRYDNAVPATTEDEAMIARMSGQSSDSEFGMSDQTISLIMDGGTKRHPNSLGSISPNWKRWQSFGWHVHGDEEVDAWRAMTEQTKRRELLRTQALAKLTDEEKEVLGLFN